MHIQGEKNVVFMGKKNGGVGGTINIVFLHEGPSDSVLQKTSSYPLLGAKHFRFFISANLVLFLPGTISAV